jgi:hypothetical protein
MDDRCRFFRQGSLRPDQTLQLFAAVSYCFGWKEYEIIYTYHHGYSKIVL